MKSTDKNKMHYVQAIATESEMEIVRAKTGQKYNQDALRELIERTIKGA